MRTDPSLSTPQFCPASTKGRVVAFGHHPRRWPPAVKDRFGSRSLVVLGIAASAFALRSSECVLPRRADGRASGFEYFHTYAENEQDIDDAVAAHPSIAQRFSIGQSYEGRQIWGIKISDNVATDENEPEVFIVAQIHASERSTERDGAAT